MYESSLYHTKTYVYNDSDNADTIIYNVLYGEEEYNKVFKKALETKRINAKVTVLSCIHPNTKKRIQRLVLNIN